MKTIKYNDFLDKVHGGWYAKCLGGAAGAPVEGIKKIIDINDFTEIYNPDLPNDDLDIQLLWLEVLETKGAHINSCDLADAWLEKCWYPFSEYGYFVKNYKRGIKPPYSGVINNSFFKEGMGCPIRSEIWGFISVGNPALAAQYAYMDATLDHADNSVYAEQFLAAVESMAFFENDMEKLFKIGLEYIPNSCKLAKCISMVTELYKNNNDWRIVRETVLRHFGHPDFSNVTQNLGFVAIALLYGKNDIRRTINIALKCGYDADCTCASAASVVGIIQGYTALGEDICELINDYFVVGIDVQRPSNSIKELASDTCAAALRVPNDEVLFLDVPSEFEQIQKPTEFKGFELEQVTEDGLRREKEKLKPICWEVYGPFFEPLEKETDTNYPSPHGEGCTLPPLECMVNNAVCLEKEYIDERGVEKLEPFCVIEAYEDLIPLEDSIQTEGQMCCYLKTDITVEADMTAWIVIGNTDGFKVLNNGEVVIARDEIRYWTPYNNFELINLKKGTNRIVLKLLRRTERLKFSIGFRMYDGSHWHRSHWHIDMP